jgi:putative oxidoreductase
VPENIRGGATVGTQRIDGQGLAMICLRIGLGLMFIMYGWAKITHVSGVVGMWERLHLIAPPVMGPIHAGVEFFGGLLILVGLLTRVWGFLLAIDMIGAIVIVKTPAAAPFAGPGGWSLEWLALWMALALLAGGGGFLALDTLLLKKPAQRRAAPA